MEELVTYRGAVECRVLRRLGRFTVLVEVPDAGELLAHNTNTGRLAGVLEPGRRAFCTPLRRPRRTSVRLLAVEYGGGFAVVDTLAQERGFEAAVDGGLLPWLRGCRVARRRPRLGPVVLDLLLDCGGARAYVELKSAVLEGPGGVALYPDCPSPRARRQLREMAARAAEARLLLVFIAAFPSARAVRPNEDADPAVARLVAEAARRGVEVRAVSMAFSPERRSVVLVSPDLPVLLQRDPPGLGDRVGQERYRRGGSGQRRQPGGA